MLHWSVSYSENCMQINEVSLTKNTPICMMRQFVHMIYFILSTISSNLMSRYIITFHVVWYTFTKFVPKKAHLPTVLNNRWRVIVIHDTYNANYQILKLFSIKAEQLVQYMLAFIYNYVSAILHLYCPCLISMNT